MTARASSGRISARFEELRKRNECAFIPFIVGGDPSLEMTARLITALEGAGADAIELGVPFSDPTADGPANQRALARGLAAGASIPALLGMVAELRKTVTIPLILFGYYNPFFRYGCERLCADAAKSGADGLLVVDLPPEESRELDLPARRNGLALVRLLAPTTPIERALRIIRKASGFIYYVSVTGVTGVRSELPTEVRSRIAQLRQLTNLPLGVGFGISTPALAAEVASFADAAIVGSAFSLIIERCAGAQETVEAVAQFAREMKAAMKPGRASANSHSTASS